MFGKRFELFSLAGFPIRLDASWFVILALLSASLATGWFPNRLEGASTAMHWGLGVAGALLLFASVLVHEMSHALVGRLHGVTTRGITLFLFGGVAEMTDEPSSARAEFLVAVVGPVTSVGIGVVALGAYLALGGVAPPALVELAGYLAAINVVLAGFNLLPAFPLDGGRVLRAALWHWKGDIESATRIASRTGMFFAGALVLLGMLDVLRGNLVGGMWIAFIGMFLWSGARMSYRQLVVRRALEDESVRDLMREDFATVPATASVRETIQEYFYRRRQEVFPVLADGELVGVVSAEDAESVPEDRRDEVTAGELAERVEHDEVRSVAPDTGAEEALRLLGRGDAALLLVVSGRRLEGVLTAEDLAHHSDVRRKLDGSSPDPSGPSTEAAA